MQMFLSAIACDATHFGVDCVENCTCSMDNTQDCNDTTGFCSCKPGWNGTKCDRGE